MPKILWVAPFSLHDTSSGAAINCRYMLKGLARLGYEVWACSTFVFNTQSGAQQAFGDLEQQIYHSANNVFVFDEDNIHYVYPKVMQTSELSMTLAECQLFFNTYRQILSEFKPDLVMGYGVSPLAQTCFAEAKAQQLATVYVVSNGTYGNYLFPNIDLIVTDSHATAQLYAERDEINMVPVGAFFDVKDITAPQHEPRFVTMINPSEHKGVSIFAKLAQVCQQELPQVQFLTVSSGRPITEVLGLLHEKGKPQVHPFHPSDFKNLHMVDLQEDMRPIYAITSVLVAPSLWFEPWGRCASEAIFNNIPVIAANSGGLSEAMAGGGVLLDTPQHCQEDYLSLPDDEEIRPWVESLKFFLEHTSDSDSAELLSTAQQRLSQENALGRLITALTPLITRSQQERALRTQPQLNLNALSDHQLAQVPDVHF